MQRKVILGVAASDAHVVANHLIAHYLRSHNFHVINLGACTPVADFAAAAREHRDAEAILIGSLNGHAFADLNGLARAKAVGDITCPVIVGGNLSVGSEKNAGEGQRLHDLGVDYVLTCYRELIPLLNELIVADELREAV